jgi:hypothetical protein
MKTVRVYVSTGIVGSKRSDHIDVDDDATEDDIEAIAKETMFEMIDWGWSVENEEK